MCVCVCGEREREKERERERELKTKHETDSETLNIEYKSFYYTKANKLFEQSSLLCAPVVATGVVMGKRYKSIHFLGCACNGPLFLSFFQKNPHVKNRTVRDNHGDETHC